MQPKSNTPDPPGAFSLSRWFQTVGLLTIAALAVVCALLLSQLITDRMLRHEGLLTMQFVHSIIQVEGGSSYFEQKPDHPSRVMEDFLRRISEFPDVLRTNLYSRERRMLWSSDATLIGQSFANDPNPELDSALNGKLEVHEESEERGDQAKPEHTNLSDEDNNFIEIYLPVWDSSGQRVVGAVEIYRAPRQLREATRAGVRIIWVGAIAAGVLLYLALLPLVRRAENMIRAQQERLVEAETLAAVGELGSAVAHGIRNPLAVIRSSAELVRDGNGQSADEAAADIMAQVDRLEDWVRQLLTYAHPASGTEDAVHLEPLVRKNVEQFAGEMTRRRIAVSVHFANDLPTVRGDSLLLGQVIQSLVSNAMDAIQHGGRISVIGELTPTGRIALRLKDSGMGMTKEQLKRALKPFHTTKPQGLGIGLPLAKRIVERMGGGITVSSEPGAGTSVEITLLAARAA